MPPQQMKHTARYIFTPVYMEVAESVRCSQQRHLEMLLPHFVHISHFRIQVTGLDVVAYTSTHPRLRFGVQLSLCER